jgi:very-short-patch-repair endonuclease
LKVIRFTNDDIHNDIQAVINKIESCLELL